MWRIKREICTAQLKKVNCADLLPQYILYASDHENHTVLPGMSIAEFSEGRVGTLYTRGPAVPPASRRLRHASNNGGTGREVEALLQWRELE